MEGKRLDVFTIVQREGQDKGFWVKCGSAWPCKDGSINVTLDALPVNGKLNLREPKEKDQAPF
jgi:hypothetical protein